MRTHRALLSTLFVAGVALAGCDAPGSAPETDSASTMAVNTPLTDLVSDKTVLTFGPHGTQVEYHAPNGQAFLWYPGNTAVVSADWKIQLDNRPENICWKYQTRSYNPLTGQPGGTWGCNNAPSYKNDIAQILDGDPFDLASGRVPYRMGKGAYDAEDLARKANLPPNSLSTLYRN